MSRIQLVPDEVLRVLSTHGQVLFVAGREDREQQSTRVTLAPFEDEILAFVSADGALEKRLLQDPFAMIHARPDSGEYSVKLSGRAVAGPRFNAHPRRMELQAWLPAGARPGSLGVVSFFAEEIEYYRGGGEDRERFQGKTAAAARTNRYLAWYHCSFGRTWPLAIVGFASAFGWLGFRGPGDFRVVALVISVVSALSLLATAGLWFNAARCDAWRKGTRGVAPAKDLKDGTLAPGELRRAMVTLGIVGGALLPFTAVWGADLTGVTVFSSFAWLVWPVALTRVFSGDSADERKEL